MRTRLLGLVAAATIVFSQSGCLKAILTKSQEKKFDAMKGKPFTFAEVPMGMGMPPKKK